MSTKRLGGLGAALLIGFAVGHLVARSGRPPASAPSAIDAYQMVPVVEPMPDYSVVFDGSAPKDNAWKVTLTYPDRPAESHIGVRVPRRPTP